MASDVYPSEQTRSPRFGSKQQLISLDSTLFILLVSDYVIKSIIYVHLQYSSQPGASQTLTSLSVFLVSNQSFDNEHFSKRGFHPGTLYKTIIFFLTNLIKTLISKNINFIKPVEVNWIENPRKKLEGILDYGAILTVSGLSWMEAYINRNKLTWEDLDLGKSKERFR